MADVKELWLIFGPILTAAVAALWSAWREDRRIAREIHKARVDRLREDHQRRRDAWEATSSRRQAILKQALEWASKVTSFAATIEVALPTHDDGSRIAVDLALELDDGEEVLDAFNAIRFKFASSRSPPENLDERVVWSGEISDLFGKLFAAIDRYRNSEDPHAPGEFIEPTFENTSKRLKA